jgi:hypothetical protein
LLAAVKSSAKGRVIGIGPAFRIGIRTARGRTRYIAASRDLDTHPHTLITGTPAELAAGLAAGQQDGCA